MDINDINSTVISEATSRNWKRLHSNGGEKLMSRANKQRSTKTILPLEYFSNKNNIADIQRFIKFCKDKNFPIENVLYSVGVGLLKRARILEKPHVKKHLDDTIFIQEVADYQLPDDEFDLLGLIYQSLMPEGEKNRKGSYFTPLVVARNMTKNLDFSDGQTFFDPCCGSGAFLLSLNGASCSQIFGCDNDTLAVMIAKFNLLLKFPDEVFDPQIVCCDFFDNAPWSSTFSFIVSNPPWGAAVFDENNKHVTTNESFSIFFEKAFKLLENEGFIRFLLPESVLNVRTHRHFRKFLLENTDIQSITRYKETFSGVQTKYIDILSFRPERSGVKRSSSDIIKMNVFPPLLLTNSAAPSSVSKKCFYLTKNLNFNLLSDKDLEKTQKILSKRKYSLKDSVWALGIVTGDNKKHLKSRHGKGLEPIYTGKEIEAYSLKHPKRFIKYNRADYQQVARDDIYRADEKLVYKFISKNLVFAYDNTKSLFLNSANILIPNIPGMSIKTVLAFLNSEVFNYIYKSLFGEIKILKGNLMELPFPEISAETDKKLTSLVDEVLNGNKNAVNTINELIYNVFEIPRTSCPE